ncbi:hypothetical protein [Methylobacterium sp. GXS13]|uniref:hypothetical protein n=1 Tax=Methylobacterium sp. GXS13 TaxID=1730094 RepID=UPI000ADD3980|nr:hypothetical protein [Methylobacterium sp. GXS13]
MSKPPLPTIEEYFENQGDQIGFSYTAIEQSRIYEFNIQAARMNVQAGTFIRNIVDELSNIAKEYANGNSHLLYYPSDPGDIAVVSKPYVSVLSKVYRSNCLNNTRYPAAPKAGIITIGTMYEKINDLLRTRLVCKYMDGPEFVCNKLAAYTEQNDIEFTYYPMASELGYYAWHCYFRLPVELMIDNYVQERRISLEIQITTQLAEVITALTHGLYETNRERPQPKDNKSWRWQPRTQQFRSAYLGHTLHLLEGIIQTFRDDVLNIGESEIDNGSAAMEPATDGSAEIATSDSEELSHRSPAHTLAAAEPAIDVTAEPSDIVEAVSRPASMDTVSKTTTTQTERRDVK